MKQQKKKCKVHRLHSSQKQSEVTRGKQKPVKVTRSLTENSCGKSRPKLVTKGKRPRQKG